MNTRSLFRRLSRVEAIVRDETIEQGGSQYDSQEEAWLARCEELGRQNYFVTEPDFPQALAEFRKAISDARAQTDPPFNDPHGLRFPEMDKALRWLLEIEGRVARGVPALSVIEFEELGNWFNENLDRLGRLGYLQFCKTHVGYAIHKGVKAIGAGDAAEDIRRLKERFPALEPDSP